MKPLKQVSWIASPQWVELNVAENIGIFRNTILTLTYENGVYWKINNDEYNIIKIKNRTDIFYNNDTNKVCNQAENVWIALEILKGNRVYFTPTFIFDHL